MTRAEAERWAASSAYPGPLYHTTSAAAAESIMRDGFTIGQVKFGRAFGNAVYVTPDPAVAAYYAQFHTGSVRILELRVNVRRVLRVRVHPTSGVIPLEQVLHQIPGGMERYVNMHLDPVEVPPGSDPRPVVFTRMVTEAGYDALEVVEPRITPAIGGTQLVIYGGRENVVVVFDGEATRPED